MIYYILGKSQKRVLDYQKDLNPNDTYIHVNNPDVVSTDSSYGVIVELDDWMEQWNWAGIDEAIERMKESWLLKGWHKDLLIEGETDGSIDFADATYGIHED